MVMLIESLIMLLTLIKDSKLILFESVSSMVALAYLNALANRLSFNWSGLVFAGP